MEAAPPLVWIDLEMTGLDPDTCEILEIATLVTDGNLELLAEGPDIVIHQPDPEDLDCGINCEPWSTRECEGGKTQVCSEEGLTWGICGATDRQPKPSSCAKGTRCVSRCPGCNMGCRAICAPKDDKDDPCESGLTRVVCEVPTPARAEKAKCVAAGVEGAYCCPAGSTL